MAEESSSDRFFLEDEDEDDFLSSIFADPTDSPAPRQSDPPRARADFGGATVDAQSLFDLGTAYREMGLIDDALSQFRQAAEDPTWTSRALVMTASLHMQRGDTGEATAALERAIQSANTDSERREARYELAIVFEAAGDQDAAIAQYQQIKAGYRDRDERLAELVGPS